MSLYSRYLCVPHTLIPSTAGTSVSLNLSTLLELPPHCAQLLLILTLLHGSLQRPRDRAWGDEWMCPS